MLSRPLSERRFAAILIGILALITALLLPWNQMLEADASVFSLVGQLWLNGAVPYKDIILFKPPMLVPISAAGDLLGSALGVGAATGTRLVSGAFVVLLGAAIAGLVRGFGVGRAIAALAGVIAVILFSSYLFSVGGGLSEPPAFALALVSWLLVERSERRTAIFAAGVLAMAALATSYLAVGVVAGAVLALLAHHAGARVRLGRLGIALGGGLALGLPILAYFALNGALAQMWSQVIYYNLPYASVRCPIANASGWPCSSDQPFWSLLILYLGILLPLILAAILGLAAKLDRAILLRLLAVLGICALLTIPDLRRPPAGHYWWPLVVGLLPPAALGLQRCVQSYSQSLEENLAADDRLDSGLVSAALKLGLGALLAAQLLIPGGLTLIAQIQTSQGLNSDSQIRAIATLADNAPGAGPLLVWGDNSQIYLASTRTPLGGMVHVYALQLPGYASAALFESICERVALARPVIVDESTDISLLGEVAPAGIGTAWLAPLRAMVAQNWVVTGRGPTPTVVSQAEGSYDTVLTPRSRTPIDPDVCKIKT